MKNSVEVRRIEEDFPIGELKHAEWNSGENVPITKFWSGEVAHEKWHVSATLLWSDSALYARFLANQFEPPVVNPVIHLNSKTSRLWEKDVCEIFITPDKDEIETYYEFEVAPTGEWLDLEIVVESFGRRVNFEYRSGVEIASHASETQVEMGLKIPWSAFGKKPEGGSVWRGNFFRLVGENDERGYLSWQPTETAEPNFHIPHRFGEFRFVK